MAGSHPRPSSSSSITVGSTTRRVYQRPRSLPPSRSSPSRSARIDLDVAREDPDLLRAELAAEVRVLLVGERLERRGVGDAPAAVERRVDGELRDERLARPRGRRDDDGLARADGGDGAELEVVQEERVAGLEGLEQIVGHAQWPLFSHLSMMVHYTRHRV